MKSLEGEKITREKVLDYLNQTSRLMLITHKYDSSNPVELVCTVGKDPEDNGISLRKKGSEAKHFVRYDMLNKIEFYDPVEILRMIEKNECVKQNLLMWIDGLHILSKNDWNII